MAKILKVTAIKNKWIENGNRLNFIGLDPHWNGVGFC